MKIQVHPRNLLILEQYFEANLFEPKCIANQKFLILKFLLANWMIYDDTQFAKLLAGVAIGVTRQLVLKLSPYLESSFDPQEKNKS